RLRLSLRFLFDVLDGPSQVLGSPLVAPAQVGNDDAEARELERRREQVRERGGGDLGKRSGPDRSGHGVVEVGGELVQEDDRGLLTNELEPRALVGSGGTILPVLSERLWLPE